jgi:hypothetical protein
VWGFFDFDESTATLYFEIDVGFGLFGLLHGPGLVEFPHSALFGLFPCNKLAEGHVFEVALSVSLQLANVGKVDG